MTLDLLFYFAPLTGFISLIMALLTYNRIKKLETGTKEMVDISNAIKEGAMAYLNRQNKTILVFGSIIFLLFVLLGFAVEKYYLGIGIAFVLGALLSGIAGYTGMIITTLGNVRTAEAAKKGLKSALDVSFKSGTVMGFALVGFGLIGISLLYVVLNYLIDINFFTYKGDKLNLLMTMLSGMAFGASLIAMFARVGGGIYTKGADVGADLVGKVEKGIPEDDPRNPAVIADNVGDNVGDCAGMGADLFESYVVTLIAAMLLGNVVFGLPGVIFPLVLAALAMIASTIGSFFVKTEEHGDPLTALNNGILITAIISAVLFFIASNVLFSNYFNQSSMGIFIASAIGILVAIAILYITDYYTSNKQKPVKDIAEASETGAGTNIITGISVGLESTGLFVFVISVGVILAYLASGIYGVAIAAMSLLSLTGIIIAVDTFGPISDNAGGIAEMSNMPKDVRNVTDKLDAVGNTTKATTKGFAIASAGLAALALLLGYANEVNIAAEANNLKELAFPVDSITKLPIVNIMEPTVIVGLFIGGVLPFVFSAFSMRAVGFAAKSIVEEVRRQFREKPGIMENKEKPDYARCVDICTKSAIDQLLLPGVIAVGTPILIGLLLGVKGVLGLLVGSLVSGMAMAVFMSNTGAAWDNAKKLIEQQGRKGTDTHKAAVVGDTVGDPFKDTSGPSINPLIKILNTLAILLVAIFLKFGLKL
ncbi:MAG: sodium-translocating pyrophosphatase [Candidatus Micrarchaeota archaeon]|nr:sodium-translocating pyrophosphatase [Candidatus Micrarchaeota archaeon]